MFIDDVVTDRAQDRRAIHALGEFGKMLTDLHSRHDRVDRGISTARFLRRRITERLRIKGIDLGGPASEPEEDAGLRFALGEVRLCPGGKKRLDPAESSEGCGVLDEFTAFHERWGSHGSRVTGHGSRGLRNLTLFPNLNPLRAVFVTGLAGPSDPVERSGIKIRSKIRSFTARSPFQASSRAPRRHPPCARASRRRPIEWRAGPHGLWFRWLRKIRSRLR